VRDYRDFKRDVCSRFAAGSWLFFYGVLQPDLQDEGAHEVSNAVWLGFQNKDMS
jgi:hypothetical protein